MSEFGHPGRSDYVTAPNLVYIKLNCPCVCVCSCTIHGHGSRPIATKFGTYIREVQGKVFANKLDCRSPFEEPTPKSGTYKELL